MDAPAETSPKWRRRKTARPGEIAAAALEVFAEKGFAAARLDDIAARAGLSKAALYRYYETKTDLFRAVVAEAVTPNVAYVKTMTETYPGSFASLLPLVLARVAVLTEALPVGPVLKMVIGESRNFPDLARIWHETVVGQGLALLTGLIRRAQERGEIRPGDPRMHAISIMGPMLMGVIWREVFVPVGAEPICLPDLAVQHGRTVLAGLAPEAKA